MLGPEGWGLGIGGREKPAERAPVWTTPENLRKMEKLEQLLRRRVVSRGGDTQRCDMCKQHKGSVRSRTTITVALSSVHWQLCDGCAAMLNEQPEEPTPNKVAASVEPRAALTKIEPLHRTLGPWGQIRKSEFAGQRSHAVSVDSGNDFC